MILYERNNGLSSNLSFTFDFGKNFSYFDCHSIALNSNENYLLLVNNHELGFINFETFAASISNTIGDENSIIIPCSTNIQSVPLFDVCNVNRPIVQWNYQDPNHYALAIDRLVRFYNVDHGRIQETNSIIDTQHQVGQKKEDVHRPGVEPGSAAWKATMLTVTPPMLRQNEFYFSYSI